MGLDTVELIMMVENHYDIEIPDNEAANLATVQHLVDFVFDTIKHDSNKNPIEIFEIEVVIREIIEKVTGIPKHKIKMHHAFTNDLGMD
ncbi:hypothetical protein [uncultured Psychroserpens sp.]|uniref:hypothetical protein n=1 Tax=uncultured Psychroserpens sp. TaxID=255436 RepID=UPI00260B5657|nr:hypothetical protein [uncultured Psychroserpens sp.]